VTDNLRYQPLSRIATGGMGEVWKALDSVLDREVALKVLKPEYADDPMFRSRFEAEARHAAALHHPNIASVFDFGEMPPRDGSDTPRPYLVMELVPGQPLSALLRGGEPLPPQTAADLVAQAADAIGAAHAIGIVHRDVKPANLLVTPEGRVKITDFGIARAADGVALTQTGQVIGTPHYLSPEQAEGLPATPASDIYALGIVLYECLAGHRPFDGDTPISVAIAHLREPVPPLPEHIPQHLRDVVAKALAKNPADRFTSAAELAAGLREARVQPVPVARSYVEQPPTEMAVGDTRILTAAEGIPPRAETARRGLPSWMPWVAAAAAVLVVAGLVSLLGGGDNRSAATPPRTTASPAANQSTQPDDRVRVRRADYVGLPVDEAKQRLDARGLTSTQQRVRNPRGRPENVVSGVRPFGLVAPDQVITLVVWGPQPKAKGPPAKHRHHENGHGNGKVKK
jgi:eukaryotic-like serine/threonine-protein kinase